MRKPLLALLVLVAPALGRAEGPAWQEDLCLLLKDLSSGKLGAVQRKEDLATLEVEARAHAARTAAPASLFLFAKDRPLEALWWEKDERAARAFVLALYLCAHGAERPGGVSDFPAFAARFRPEEASERREELAFVGGHLSAIASLLARAEKALGLQHHESYALYRATAAEASGEPLLCVPDTE
jgi:hypothetical protein